MPDPAEFAFGIMQRVIAASGDTPTPAPVEEIPLTPDGKNAAAVALGRLGGRKGGPARAKKLSAKRRAEIARKAAKSRWRANP